MTKPSKPSGYVLEQTKDTVVIATGFTRSVNVKTGDMAQIWIMPTKQDPVEAHRTGEQKKVCGDCPVMDTCYVNVHWAPRAIYDKWRDGGYPPITDFSVFQDKDATRLGAWGDPYFVDPKILEMITKSSKGWTGYTHQWRKKDADHMKDKVMASVDSPDEQIDAVRQGWRTFRTKLEGQPKFSDELVCPASEEGGHKVQCVDCLLCCGTSMPAKNIVINAHGNFKSKFKG